MIRFRFEWNSWSTGPVTGAIVVGSWALVGLVVGLALSLFDGSSGAFAISLAKALFATALALFTFALAAGVVVERAAGLGTAGKLDRTPARSGLPR